MIPRSVRAALARVKRTAAAVYAGDAVSEDVILAMAATDTTVPALRLAYLELARLRDAGGAVEAHVIQFAQEALQKAEGEFPCRP